MTTDNKQPAASDLSASAGSERECPDCNGGGLVKGSNEYEWETYLERCEMCNGDGHVEVQNTEDSRAKGVG